MNAARMALILLGAGLIITAMFVVYYNTQLRNQLPEGAAIAIILAVAGLFAIGFASEFRRDRVKTIQNSTEHHEHVDAVGTRRPARPYRSARSLETGDVDESEHSEHVEVIRRD